MLIIWFFNLLLKTLRIMVIYIQILINFLKEICHYEQLS